MDKHEEIDSKVTGSFIEIKQEIGDIKKEVTPKVGKKLTIIKIMLWIMLELFLKYVELVLNRCT